MGPHGREELCFSASCLSFCPTPSDDLHFVRLYFCGLCSLLLITLFPLESALSVSFCTHVSLCIQPVWGSQALSSLLLVIPSPPPFPEDMGWVGKLCGAGGPSVASRPPDVGSCLKPGGLSNRS